jgi:hypothetical protein
MRQPWREWEKESQMKVPMRFASFGLVANCLIMMRTSSCAPKSLGK